MAKILPRKIICFVKFPKNLIFQPDNLYSQQPSDNALYDLLYSHVLLIILLAMISKENFSFWYLWNEIMPSRSDVSYLTSFSYRAAEFYKYRFCEFISNFNASI